MKTNKKEWTLIKLAGVWFVVWEGGMKSYATLLSANKYGLKTFGAKNFRKHD